MLKRRTLHRDMADVNVYTARRLKSMALSLGGLAQAFADEGGRAGGNADGGVGGMRRLYTVQPVLWQPPGRQLLSLLSASDVRAEREN